MTDTYNSSHPHEPAIPPTFDAEGRCLVCGLLVRCEEAQTERDAALQEVAGAEVTHQRLRDQRDEALAALREAARYEPMDGVVRYHYRNVKAYRRVTTDEGGQG